MFINSELLNQVNYEVDCSESLCAFIDREVNAIRQSTNLGDNKILDYFININERYKNNIKTLGNKDMDSDLGKACLGEVIASTRIMLEAFVKLFCVCNYNNNIDVNMDNLICSGGGRKSPAFYIGFKTMLKMAEGKGLNRVDSKRYLTLYSEANNYVHMNMQQMSSVNLETALSRWLLLSLELLVKSFELLCDWFYAGCYVYNGMYGYQSYRPYYNKYYRQEVNNTESLMMYNNLWYLGVYCW